MAEMLKTRRLGVDPRVYMGMKRMPTTKEGIGVDSNEDRFAIIRNDHWQILKTKIIDTAEVSEPTRSRWFCLYACVSLNQTGNEMAFSVRSTEILAQ